MSFSLGQRRSTGQVASFPRDSAKTHTRSWGSRKEWSAGTMTSFLEHDSILIFSFLPPSPCVSLSSPLALSSDAREGLMEKVKTNNFKSSDEIGALRFDFSVLSVHYADDRSRLYLSDSLSICLPTGLSLCVLPCGKGSESMEASVNATCLPGSATRPLMGHLVPVARFPILLVSDCLRGSMFRT